MAFTLDRLPGDWESYSAYDKINFFNEVGVTPDDLRSYGVDNSTIEWMYGNGYGVADIPAVDTGEQGGSTVQAYVPQEDVYGAYTEPEPTVYRENVRYVNEPEPVYVEPEPVTPQYSEQDIANAYNHYAGLGYTHDQIQDLANQVGIGDVSRFQPAPPPPPPPAPEPVDPYAAFHRMGGITYDEPSNVNTFVDTTYGVPSYGDMTGDLEVSGPGVMNLGDYILPTGQGVDLRDDIGEDLSGPTATLPAVVDTTTGETGYVVTPAPITNYTYTAPTYIPSTSISESGVPITSYIESDYVPGSGGYTDLGGYDDIYEPNIPATDIVVDPGLLVGNEKGPEDYQLPSVLPEVVIPEGASTGLAWALNNGMDTTTYYNNIKDFVTQIVTSNLGDSDKAASLQAAMDLYGVSANDISAAIGQSVDTVNNFLAAANAVDPRISGQLPDVDTSGNAVIQTTGGGGVGGNTSAGIGYNPDTPEGTAIGLNARNDERSIYQSYSDDGTKIQNTIQTGILDNKGNPIAYDAVYDFNTGQTTYRVNVNGEIITSSTRPDFEGNVMYMGDRGINLRETGAADASVTVTAGTGGATDTTARLPSSLGPVIPDYTNITGGGVVAETKPTEVKPTEPQYTNQQLQDALNTTTAADVKYMYDTKMIDSLDADVALEYAMVNKLGYTPERAREILSQLDASALRQSVTNLKQLENVKVQDVIVGNVSNVTGNLANVTLSNVQIANLANVASNIANVVVSNVFTGNVVNTIANLSNANVETITFNNQANVVSNVANIIANNITSGNASNITTSIANVIANNITVGNVSNVTANLIDSVVSNIVTQEVMNVVSNTSNVTLANVTSGNVSNVVSNVANANVANLTTGNVSNVSSNVGNITVANVNMGNIANITANTSNITLSNILNKTWFTWGEKEWNLFDSLVDTQTDRYTVDSNGKVTITNANLANVPPSIANVFVANTSGNVSNVSGNITVANIGNLTSNTLGNLFGNANVVTNANVIGNTLANIVANGLPNANVVANVLPNANVVANVLTNANVNANVIANANVNANVIANVIPNANVIANVLPNANVIANVEPNANVNANVIPNVFIPNVFPNVFPNVNANITTNIANLTPNIANIGNISLQTGGLNPGWIAPTPFYQTTSPVQSQFYWGAHPYQPGPTFSETLYNTAPAAPRTPWGIQQIATAPIRYEDLLAQLYGRMPTSNNTANQVATPVNPNYGNFSSVQPFSMPMSYKLLPTLTLNPVTTQYVSNTGNVVAGPVVPTTDWSQDTGF